MNLSIVIPNYNGEKIMQKNLPIVLDAVKDYKNGTVEIIIPDDPSTDKSKEVIKTFIENIKEKHITGKTIENKNRNESGFSKNVNRGVSLATGEILILLNTDVSPHKNFLEPLLKHFSDEKVFGVACMDESVEENGIVLRGRGIGKWRRGFLMHSEGQLDKTDTLWLSGGSCAIRLKYWERIRGLDPLFNPFYWEDIDLGYRALKSGYRLVFEKESVVRHEHEEGAIKTKFKSSHIKKIAYRNQFIFVWKNITERKFLFSHLFWLPYHMINALRNRDIEFIHGFAKAILLLPNIMESRSRATKLFVKSDAQILKEFSR